MSDQVADILSCCLQGTPWTEKLWPPNRTHAFSLYVSVTIALVLSLLLGCLFLSHTLLTLQNKTTIEANYYGSSPYSEGARNNCEQLLGPFGWAWCLPIAPSRPCLADCVGR